MRKLLRTWIFKQGFLFSRKLKVDPLARPFWRAYVKAVKNLNI
ncbi:MAG: hypothetical protein UY64_C0015G0005 [Parcubacteria group bacterium GW2011_GWA1_51_12]|nr:MAG: hypothetical protein UY64_C0015G0005 [Parcubacteria group bacterium GW2011_GWA1_51_12]